MTSTVFAALSVATVPMPASNDGQHRGDQHLVSIGLFAGTVVSKRWRFINRAAAIGAGEPEALLLRWLIDHLPTPATLIGYQLDSRIIPALIGAAATAPAEVALASMARLAEASRSGAVDLALDYGGAAALPQVEIAADHGIGTSITTDEQHASHWAFGEVDQLRGDAADQALGVWRLLLRTAHFAGIEAEAATEQWLQRRRRLRSIPGGRSTRSKATTAGP